MWKQIRTKKYWTRVAGFFLWFLVIYTLVDYAFEEDRKLFWSLEKIQRRFIFILFMSTLFAFRHREQPNSGVPDDDDMVQKKWGLKEFFGVFGLLLLFATIIMSILFGIGWLVMHLAYDEVEPAGKIFVKMLVVTAIMTFISTLLLFLADRFNIWWGRRS